MASDRYVFDAAPDLLAALKRLLTAASIAESDCAYDQGEQDEAYEQARVAIAKAEGRQLAA